MNERISRQMHLALGLSLVIVTLTASVGLAGTRHTFLEAGWVRFDLDGDFDDSLILSTSTQVINVPEVLETEGLHIGIGGAGSRGGFSFSYFSASPQTVSVFGNADARFRLYGMEGYVLPFAAADCVAPLFRIGGAFATLTIEDSASDGVRLEDAKFHGVDGTLGIGVLVRIGRLGQLIGELDRHWVSYNTVDGVGDNVDIDDGLTAATNFIKVSFSFFL